MELTRDKYGGAWPKCFWILRETTTHEFIDMALWPPHMNSRGNSDRGSENKHAKLKIFFCTNLVKVYTVWLYKNLIRTTFQHKGSIIKMLLGYGIRLFFMSRVLKGGPSGSKMSVFSLYSWEQRIFVWTKWMNSGTIRKFLIHICFPPLLLWPKHALVKFTQSKLTVQKMVKIEKISSMLQIDNSLWHRCVLLHTMLLECLFFFLWKPFGLFWFAGNNELLHLQGHKDSSLSVVRNESASIHLAL
jgi:hypothetical protein